MKVGETGDEKVDAALDNMLRCFSGEDISYLPLMCAIRGLVASANDGDEKASEVLTAVLN
jgi:hypothetical protein